MSLKHLGRDDAPFGEKVWEYIDRTVVGAAKAELSIRRIIDVEGPYGLGTKSVPRPDRATKLEASLGRAAATVMGSEALGLAGVRSGFVVAPRDVAAFEQTGVAFDAAPVAEAAGACARLEDRLLLEGSSELGVEGLLKAKGALSKKLGSWSEVGAAASDVIAAVTELDRAGMHGPYALALAPALYNLLFRRYRQGQQTEIDHIKRVVTEGVVKAPALEKGALLVATGRQYLSIVLGQDIAAGFIGPGDEGYEFAVTETVALRISRPEAICILQAGK